MNPMLTNAHIYRAIAEEALMEAERLEQEARQPKPDGSSGQVVKLDQERKSFKQSLIAIAFSGVYLEALLYVKGMQRIGDKWEKKFDRKTYEEKLKALGISDDATIESAARLRKVRKDLVHEKSVPMDDLTLSNTYWAQTEAQASIACIRSIATVLNNVT